MLPRWFKVNQPSSEFELLEWRVLLPSLFAFALILTPVWLEQPLIVLVMLVLAAAGMRFAKVHALGLGLIGIPAVLSLLLQSGTIADKSWATLLTMLEFFALQHLLWGLEEEVPQPWRLPALMWLLMPNPIGLLGVLLLMLLCHARWTAGLALARAATKQSKIKDWVWVGLLVVVVSGVSALLPLPAVGRLSTPNLPVLSFSGAVPVVESVATIVSNQPTETAPTRVISGEKTDWTIGLGLVAMLMVAYLFYIQRVLGNQAPTRGQITNKSAGGWLWILLLLLTIIVLAIAMLGLSNPNKTIVLQLDPSQWGWLAPIFFLGLIVAWRMTKKRRAKNKSTEALASSSELEQMRYFAPKEAVRAAYFKWLVMLRDLEIRRNQSQTPLELLGVINNAYPHLQDHSTTLTESYQKVRYGTTPEQTEISAVLGALTAWQTEMTSLQPSITPQMVDSEPL